MPARWSPARLASLRRRLLAWYDANGRDLPWRRKRDPYRVLVSEIMLQQTQVATVLPYYERFLTRFPSMEALAEAPEDDVRALWSGLGYYRRARSLLAISRIAVREHGGSLPADLDALKALPGIGDYTSAALASILHGIPKAVVDGNVARVLARLKAIGTPPSRARKEFQDLADVLLDPARPGDWNQAMMELGAVVCTPREPQCGACPIETDCLATRDDPARYPAKDPKRSTIAVERAVGVIQKGEHVLLLRRSDPSLLDGTWELPGIDVSGAGARAALAEHLATVFKGSPRVGEELVRVKHAITHRRITVRAYAVRLASTPRASSGKRAWVHAGSLEDLFVSSMTSKIIRALARNPLQRD